MTVDPLGSLGLLMPLFSEPATQRAEKDHIAHEEDTVSLGILSVGGNVLENMVNGSGDGELEIP